MFSDGLISLTLSLSLPKPEGARALPNMARAPLERGTRTSGRGARTDDSDTLTSEPGSRDAELKFGLA